MPENISLLPNASCFSTVLRNTTLAVVDTYLPAVSSDKVSCDLSSGEGGGDGSVRGSG